MRGVRGVLKIRMVGRVMRVSSLNIVLALWRVFRDITVRRVRL